MLYLLMYFLFLFIEMASKKEQGMDFYITFTFNHMNAYSVSHSTSFTQPDLKH